jgi:hypothetical protein
MILFCHAGKYLALICTRQQDACQCTLRGLRREFASAESQVPAFPTVDSTTKSGRTRRPGVHLTPQFNCTVSSRLYTNFVNFTSARSAR